MRLFIAILFDDDTVDKLSALRDGLHDLSSHGSFVQRENLHLTLEFLGECSAEERNRAMRAMDSLSFPSFRLKLDRLGFFSRPDGDIWWVGIEKNKALENLHSQLSQELEKRGFKLEKKRFKPHITLARRVITNTKDGRMDCIRTDIDSVSLMISERGNGRMIYTELYRVRALNK